MQFAVDNIRSKVYVKLMHLTSKKTVITELELGKCTAKKKKIRITEIVSTVCLVCKIIR